MHLASLNKQLPLPPRSVIPTLSLLSILLFALGCSLIRVKETWLKRNIWQAGLEHKIAELGPDRISYWEGGEGPTLLLLHGFGADATFGWNDQVSVLSKHYHLIIPDLLWFGQSTSTDPTYSAQHQIQALLKLLEHVGVKHFNVAGISYGGILSMMLLAQVPQQIEHAVIISSPGPVYTHEDYQALLKRFQVHSVNELVLPRNLAGLDRLLEIAYKKPPYIPSWGKQSVLDFLQDGPDGEKKALLRDLIANLDTLRTGLDKHSYKGPLLIIWGGEDTLFPIELGKRLKDYFGDQAELEVIPKGRHAPNIEFSAKFNKILLQFLKKPSSS